MDDSPQKRGLQLWARKNMRVCGRCGRKYIMPNLRAGLRDGQWYKSERKRPDICWRCEKELTPDDEVTIKMYHGSIEAAQAAEDEILGA